MAQTASRRKFIAEVDGLFVAFELGWKSWKLAFASGLGEKPWQVTIPARDAAALVGLNPMGRVLQKCVFSDSPGTHRVKRLVRRRRPRPSGDVSRHHSCECEMEHSKNNERTNLLSVA